MTWNISSNLVAGDKSQPEIKPSRVNGPDGGTGLQNSLSPNVGEPHLYEN